MKTVKRFYLILASIIVIVFVGLNIISPVRTKYIELCFGLIAFIIPSFVCTAGIVIYDLAKKDMEKPKDKNTTNKKET